VPGQTRHSWQVQISGVALVVVVVAMVAAVVVAQATLTIRAAVAEEVLAPQGSPTQWQLIVVPSLRLAVQDPLFLPTQQC